MDAKSKRIAELLAKASPTERQIFNACLTTGAYLRLTVAASARRSWRYAALLPPILIGDQRDPARSNPGKGRRDED